MLELTFWGSDLKAARPVPVVIGADFAPRVVRGARARVILDRVWAVQRRPDASAPGDARARPGRRWAADDRRRTSPAEW